MLKNDRSVPKFGKNFLYNENAYLQQKPIVVCFYVERPPSLGPLLFEETDHWNSSIILQHVDAEE
jgi:hypothetical protein